MTLKIVPPKESLRPKRKQNFYDFSIETFNYTEELNNYRDSEEFNNESSEVKESIIKELEILHNLNEFQINEIEKF